MGPWPGVVLLMRHVSQHRTWRKWTNSARCGGSASSLVVLCELKFLLYAWIWASLEQLVFFTKTPKTTSMSWLSTPKMASRTANTCGVSFRTLALRQGEKGGTKPSIDLLQASPHVPFCSTCLVIVDVSCAWLCGWSRMKSRAISQNARVNVRTYVVRTITPANGCCRMTEVIYAIHT